MFGEKFEPHANGSLKTRYGMIRTSVKAQYGGEAGFAGLPLKNPEIAPNRPSTRKPASRGLELVQQ